MLAAMKFEPPEFDYVQQIKCPVCEQPGQEVWADSARVSFIVKPCGHQAKSVPVQIVARTREA